VYKQRDKTLQVQMIVTERGDLCLAADIRNSKVFLNMTKALGTVLVKGLLCKTTIRHFPTFLISNFRCVLNVVCFLLGNYPVSEFYMPTFRNTVPSS
jgi:hypothetical protein